MIDHYTLQVVHGTRLSVANKRSIRSNVRRLGLRHDDWKAARAAARELSTLPAVRAVYVMRILRYGRYSGGRKVGL